MSAMVDNFLRGKDIDFSNHHRMLVFDFFK